jgi:hypothetical protein
MSTTDVTSHTGGPSDEKYALPLDRRASLGEKYFLRAGPRFLSAKTRLLLLKKGSLPIKNRSLLSKKGALSLKKFCSVTNSFGGP